MRGCGFVKFTTLEEILFLLHDFCCTRNGKPDFVYGGDRLKNLESCIVGWVNDSKEYINTRKAMDVGI